MTYLTCMKIIKGSSKAFSNHLLLSLSLRLLMFSKDTLGKSLAYFLRLALIKCPKCIKGTYLCWLRIYCCNHIM